MTTKCPSADAPGATARWCREASSAAGGTGCSPDPGAAARGPAPRAHRRTPRTRARRSRCRPAGNARARSSSRRPPASFLRKSWTWASWFQRGFPTLTALFRCKVPSRSPAAQLYFTPKFTPSRSWVLINNSRGKTSRLAFVGSLRAKRIGRKRRGWAEPGAISIQDLGAALWTTAPSMHRSSRWGGSKLSSGGAGACTLPLPPFSCGRGSGCLGYGS